MTENSAAFATVEQWIANLKTLSPNGINAVARDIADAIEAELQGNIEAARAPDGTAWAPRKRDGARALVGAGKALSTKVVESTLLITLTGHEVFHNFGTSRVPARPILPTADNLPNKLGLMIRKDLVDGIDDWLNKKGRKHDRSYGVKVARRRSKR